MPDQTGGPIPASVPPGYGAETGGFPWARLGLAVFYAVVLWLVFWAVLLVTATQFVTRLFSSSEAEQLKSFSAGLARYMGQTVGYLTFVHDDRPFPFGPLPKA